MSCSKEDSNEISLSESSVTLHFGDEYQIVASSETDITYKVKDDYHATVTGTGFVTARYIGETDITLNNEEDTKVFKLTVAATKNLYPEPDVEYDMSKNSVIQKFGTPGATADDAIGYYNYSSKAPMLMFLFDSNDRLIAYGVLVEIGYASDLVEFLLERYPFIEEDTEDELLWFTNGLTEETATMFICSGLFDSANLLVAYYYIDALAESTSLKSTKTLDNLDHLKEQIKYLR